MKPSAFRMHRARATHDVRQATVEILAAARLHIGVTRGLSCYNDSYAHRANRQVARGWAHHRAAVDVHRRCVTGQPRYQNGESHGRKIAPDDHERCCDALVSCAGECVKYFGRVIRKASVAHRLPSHDRHHDCVVRARPRRRGTHYFVVHGRANGAVDTIDIDPRGRQQQRGEVPALNNNVAPLHWARAECAHTCNVGRIVCEGTRPDDSLRCICH